MAKVTLVTGGARSGKSRFAESLAVQQGEPLLYIATAGFGDGEMKERITRHQERRGSTWQTIEEQYNLAAVLTGHDGWFKAILVDCVTLWLTNLLLKYEDKNAVLDEVRRTVSTLPSLKTPLFMVSNEVGMGIIPDNSLGRTFCDLSGEANEILAGAADEVYVTFSGLPLKLK
ncbi:MAG: bifunctional adenosylcobinamide kinase/adenosylcobinamide-phosphate guanylyltransferase [Deltaproteobacteria bacterium HGW-Deltaproteobacteria-23]|jgi:adenosylcobinamide kinase/adenosylcobinamide-phosphate guanylyltransferase|nr:MAG: bifunctional adenosylcobinamide kinase/adenosylcobinamide-phosphate guanylyltransferase [Deltaproteobacteria bacterium HGW-Deltaproteobacteria-23]